MSEQSPDHSADAIAIVGMAGRFPRAGDLQGFWRNLWAGEEGVSFFSREELLAAGVSRSLVENPAYVPARAALAGIELFDAAFFGFSPREAEITNPQHRLFLECSWQALEDAGCDPAAYPGAIGVFASASANTYPLRLHARPDLVQRMGSYRIQIANDREFLPTWVSYKLDLRGPSINVQTACSSSLVALHMACQSLLNGECDLALAGGVSIRGLAAGGYLYQEGGILAPDGHCRAFDADAAGTVDGDGVGIVVLKRLEDALAGGDNIQAVVLGSAVNNDGSAKAGYTAPSQEGQTRVITEALLIAGVDPATLGYVEAHGTGTRLGDPVEISALAEAFRGRTRRTGFCAVGSVKSSIGHLDAAAGVAGLIKTVLALRHRRLPPSLHFRRPNPEIDFAKTPFYVNASPAEWPTNGHPRRAGVSSFGIGGTNVHVILEEAPPAESGPSRAWKLLLWSARTETALATATADLARFLGTTGEDLADIAHTLRGRRAFEQRRALVCRDAREAAAILERAGAREVASSPQPARQRPVAFLFPGQGAQRPGMTLELYQSEPVFRAEVDLCAERLRPHLGGDLREVLYPATAGEEAERRLLETAWAQPALFTVAWALTRLWASWGVRPKALLGHSVGEYVAACVAETLDLDGALALVAARGRLMQSLPAGAMLAVPLGEEEIRPLLGGGLSIAAVNAPRRTVVAGPLPEVEELERRLAGQGIEGRRLRTSHAFHAPMMDPVLPAFAERVRAVPRKAPKIPYLSNVTGDWVTSEEAVDPDSWVRQLRSPVRFGDAVARLLRDPDMVLVEMGPGQALTGLVLQHPDLREGHLAVPALRAPGHPGSEEASLLDALGRLWVAGVEVDWSALTHGERRRRVSLPAYPFEAQRYWSEPRRMGSPTNEESRMPEPTPTTTPETTRRDQVLDALKEIVRDLTGADPGAVDPKASFLEAGVDSLLLIQATQRLQDRFGVKLSLLQLLEELTTLDRVAGHLARELPEEWFAASLRNAPVPAPEPPPAAASVLERVVTQQLQLMAYQLQLLQGAPASPPEPPAGPVAAPLQAPPPALPSPEPAAYTRFGPYHPIEIGPQGGLTPRQQAYLEAFIRRYNARTPRSKQMTQSHRPVLADSRASVGFRRLWKELIYPIHAERAKGSRIQDVDGNEYVDINMGFGLHFFGHSPDFVVEAMDRQMRTGLALGPQSPLAGRAAELVCELTGMDRAVFCNSGTEAVMGALRVARTFTRRNKIALFSQSYHGWADPTLARAHAVDGRKVSVPVAPGVPPGVLGDVLVLDYLSPRALEELEKHGEELAAVLVEPVRSRSPEVQPRDFLRRVRELTARSGTVLIFDEMVTGFRIHPGGAQAYFGIEADLATYGKLVAAGLPIGVVAGRSRFMDVLDGGMWSFGDDSYPTAEKTLMAGAFFKHPLTMAASCAVLERMRREGPALHERLNARTARLAADLNADFAAAGVPIEVVCFGSLFRFRIPRELQNSDLFFYHLIEKGVFYTLESGNCFLSTAHDEEDLDQLRLAVQEGLEDLREGGFLSGSSPRSPRGRREPVQEKAFSVREIPTADFQRALWTEASMEADASRSYNEPLVLRLRGPFHLQALRRSFQGLVDRHEALRSCLSADGTRWRIASSLEVDISLADLSALGEPEREAQLLAWLDEQIGQPFHLQRTPLIRCGVACLATTDHCLALTLHHIVIDGQSGGVLIREMRQLYEAACQGEPISLEEPASFEAVLHRLASATAEKEEAESYWTGVFADSIPALELPTDRLRSRALFYAGALQGLPVTPWLSGELARLGARSGATHFMTLLAACGLLLHHLTGQNDLILGVPSRDLAAGSAVGFFTRLLPLRLRTSDSWSFRDYLDQTRRSLVELQEHRACSLSRLADKLRKRREWSRPLVEATFNLERGSGAPRFKDLDAEVLRLRPKAAKFDLSWNVIDERDSSLFIQCAYRTHLFDPSTVERWLIQLEQLLTSMVLDPDARAADLPLLSASHRQQLIVEWNDTRGDSLPQVGLHELFEEWARRTPEAVAVIFGSQVWTYGELEGRSERWAAHLQRLGVGPEVRVGLFLERSFEVLVGLLAILKAGGVYVPLDPTTPRERLLFLLDDARVPLLLTQRSLAADLGEPFAGFGGRLLDLGAELPADEIVPTPRRPAGPDGLAYVIYTSGSTGVPNGVMVPHRGAVNLLRAARNLYGVDSDSRVLQMLFFGFDASVLEIFLALGSGASLCMLTEEERRAPLRVAETILREGVTTAVLTPSVLSVLPEELLASVRSMSVGGEVCSRELVTRWAPGRRLLNCYGPTEATIFATAEVCSSEQRAWGGPSIGRAVANIETYVVDRELRPVPIGVAGELLLGGPGLARGYLERPDKTARCFVPHPFAALQVTPGARLYRTGDLVRMWPDGRIDFLGRLDTQVKVRGFRVELGEIETVLSELPGVREAAVAVHGEREARKLVAYVVATEDRQGRIVPGLRQSLRERLPEYMVPALWVELAEPLPRTPIGKVDRRSLPAPREERGDPEQETAPRTALESFLVDLWREVLQVERVGLQDDFFALGGHSITGAVLVNRLQEALGEIVHVVVMFDASTVATLARYLGEHYPETVARIWGPESLPDERRISWPDAGGRVDEARVEELRRAIVPLAPLRHPVRPKNPQAVFVLSPPRSGSTLLRVLLGGHPWLFSPPELELLSFHTLAERRAAFTGRNSYWLEGTTRAVMEILGCDAEMAERVIAEKEGEPGGTTQELYRWIQNGIGQRRLVDKTPSYALDLEVLRRAEEIFEEPLYIHLARHPGGMIHSFEEARLDQVFFRHPHGFGRRELAELLWVVSQQNILRFLEGIPESRHHRVCFERLVREPGAVLEGICAFLGLELHPDMLEPYQRQPERMTDGIHSWSRMLGDVKFHQHAGIEAEVAERWRERLSESGLGEITRNLAIALGYDLERDRTKASWASILPVPREPGKPLPLSFAQQRLWFLDQLDPSGTAYNIPTAVRLVGVLDGKALAASLNGVVARHEALRTTFGLSGGEPVQRIAACLELPLPLVDLSGLAAPVREAEARRLASGEARRPFDLAAGPLVRATLVRLAECEHVLLTMMHHIVSDGWSMGILIQEVGTLYAAFAQGRLSPLPPLPIQYADFAVWQRSWLAGEGLQQALAYWRKRLEGAPALLELPTDRPRKAVQSFRGGRVSFGVPEKVAEGLRALGRRRGATPFMVMLAAYAVLLRALTDRTDLLVGTPVAHRNRAEIERLIGFFVNTLVLRCDLGGTPSFEEILDRVREMTLGAYAHQDLPFEKLVEELRPERNLSHAPLFQVMLVLQNAPAGATSLPGLSVRSMGLEASAAKFDLTLAIAEGSPGLSGSWSYNRDLFDASSIRRISEQLQVLLEAIVSEPVRSLDKLPVLTEGQRQQLLLEWSVASVLVESEAACLHELFLEWARRTPEAVAVALDVRQWTYGELEERSERWSARLRGLGVGPEVRVGLYLERSFEMVTGLLAIFAAGGAYVPLDPANPRERLLFLLEDARVPLLLTQRHLAADLEEPLRAQGIRVLCLDEEPPSEEIVMGPWRPAGPENLAYVIYTSGSTGAPNGVMIPHRGAVNAVREACRLHGVSSDSRLLQVISLGFDPSVLEIFLALGSGASLCLAGEPERRMPSLLAETIERQGVTAMVLTPSLLSVLPSQGLPSVRSINVGGEVCSAELVAQWAPGRRLLNFYGPTEASIFVTAQVCTNEGGPWGGPPIGRAVAHVETYVVNRELEPVPIGGAGELLLGGMGLARGYLERPDKTAQRFVPHPFAALRDAPGARLYRTGDLVRMRPDGRLDFLGRLDTQVKVRGFRIELEEVETALSGMPGVREAAVAVEGGSERQRLVGYVVPEEGWRGRLGPALRASLQDRLPDYMVPGAWVELATLPRTASGKVNRQALLAARQDPDELGQESTPRTALESALAGLWREILQVERVGLHDNFFTLGGHSITGAVLTNRLQEVLGESVHVVAIFDHPTVAALARHLEASHPERVSRLRGEKRLAEGWGAQQAWASIVPVRREPGRPLPLSFAQQRLWFLDQLDPGSSAYNVPTAMRLVGDLDWKALAASLNQVVARHEALRTTFGLSDGEPVQRIAGHLELPLATIDLKELSAPERDAEVRRLASEEARRSFDLAAGPLVRATLLRLGEAEHVILLTLHHIVSDGWSMGVLIRDVGALYAAFAGGRPSPLPPLPIQYADFAVWQRSWLTEESLEQQLAYWRKRLEGAPALLDLPTDRPRPAVQRSRGGHVFFQVPEGVGDELRALGQRRGATLFMVLLAACDVLLRASTGQDDLLVGTPVANRNRSEVEGLIGFFVNTLVLRSDLAGSPTFEEVLDRVREVTVEAYAHQDLPFEKLVEELRPERNLSHSPLFQAMLVLQSAPAAPAGSASLPGLRLQPIDTEAETTKFDLSLDVEDGARGLSGSWSYNSDLFDASTISRLSRRWITLLEVATAGPGRSLPDLPLLTEGELQQLLEWSTWSGLAPRERAPLCIHELFSEQARRMPDAVAIRSAGLSCTYAELDRRAGALARRLRKLGIGPESRVGLLAERSADLAVAVLGVWKAGGAYVPLDPGLPQARLAFMVEDALGSRTDSILLTQRDLGTRLDELPRAGVRTAFLDEAETGAEAADLEARPELDHLAYLIYTSGTTGRPKAVQVEHGNLSHTLWAVREAFGFAVGDRMPCLAPFSFDIFLFELFAPLLSGGTVMFFDLQPTIDLPGLMSSLPEVTLIHAVPAVMRHLVEAVRRTGRTAPGIRCAFVGGDAVAPDLLAGMREAFPDAEIAVLYGPTEATILAASYRLGGELPTGNPIGRPLPGSVLRVFGPDHRPVSIGVAGELYLGGPGVARGYEGHTELTEEKFVHWAGLRWYRTGDRVRWLPDGQLEFLGRIDQQVKIRGFRVELGEIEASLRAQETVREAAVAVQENAVGDRWLAAFVVPAGAEADPSRRETWGDWTGGLASSLRTTLPEHMVPVDWVVLGALPLTPHGKVDRLSLQAPQRKAGELEEEASPWTALECFLVALWCEVLQVEWVGLHDDFFALGGHSIKAAVLANRLQEALGEIVRVVAIFDAPTVAELAIYLGDRHPEAVARVWGERGGARRDGAAQTSGASIPPLPREPGKPLPVSFAQQRLWFLDRLGVAGSTYNVAMAVRLRGALDVAALSAALSEIVRRHEVLRTTFHEIEGEPFQRIAPPSPFPLPFVDLSSLAEPECSREAGLLADLLAQRPFDLARGPLLRPALARVDTREHLVLFTMHHIVSDGWSVGVLVRELGALYEAFSEAGPSPLPDLRIQYADFASWQRQQLAGEMMQASLAYWREQLGDAPPVLELPTDRPRPMFPTLHGAYRTFGLSRELTTRLREMSQREGVTLFMTLLAALQALLSRYSGQDSIAVGTPVAGRNHAQTEDLIGFFVNTLVLRTDLAGDLGWLDLIRRVRRVVLGAYTHQDIPFEKLVEDLQPARSLNHSPLFQVMFVFQNLPREPLRLPGLLLEPVDREGRSAKFDLTLLITETGGALGGLFEYNTDLLNASTSHRLANHFVTLLEGFARDPRGPLSALSLLSPAEQAQALREWNDTAAGPSSEELVHEAIAGWAERTPDAPALLSEGRTVTYRELQLRADRLAAFLRAAGVALEDRVGVCLEPSPEMVVALLGILGAGAAYLPLDPDHPAERRSRMLEDAGVGLLLTRERFRETLSMHPVRLACLDAEEIGTAGMPEAAPLDDGNAAYVIYTSGSTGRPKGVVATHGGLASFARSMAESMALRPGDRVLQFASLAFDASAVQIFPTLVRGATLVLHPNPRGLSADELLELCARTEVTVLDLPAALWRQWIADVAVSRPRIEAPIRLYMTGGEAVPAAVLRDWARRMAPGTGFFSSYGPTEATVTATAFQTTSSDVEDLWLEEVPMGRPLAGVQIYIFDTRLAPVPVGVAGEVFIGGAGVTRGYFRHPAGTAERYVPDPWSGGPGGRLYRTGDLARRRADGTLQFLGRHDHQVKIRGFRIELGEIEAAIRGCPGVREPAVVLHEDSTGERRLVACVVPEEAVALSPHAILSAVRDVLPASLVPSHVLPFAELPLTTGGKVDRRELARKVGEILRSPVLQREVVLPRTPTELRLAQLWEELLDVHPIGVRDNFFELGGHSLLAVRLTARIKARLGQDLPLAALFEEPTVEHLARRLDAAHGRPAWSPLVSIQPQGQRAPFFCVHPIGGGVLGYRDLARHLGPDQPFYALQAPGLDVQAGAPHSSIKEMASAYLAEIHRVQPGGPYLLGGASFGGIVAFEMAQQLHRQGDRVEILALFDSPVPQGRVEGREVDLTAAAAALAREQFRQLGKHLELTADDLRGLPLEEQLERILEGLREIQVVGTEVDVPLFLQFLQGFQARLSAVERYQAKPYSGRVHLFRPLELDPESLRLATAERLKILEDPALGWGKLAAAGVEVYKVPGYHDTMLSEPNVRDLAKLLDTCISQQLGASPEPDVL